MSLWENVKTGFDSDDETVNFGARRTVEAEHGSFECVTIATFEAGGQVDGFPSLRSSVTAEKLCVAVGKNIFLFNTTAKSEVSSLCFGSTVECLSLTEDGKFLLICVQNGSLHVVFTATNEVIFSKSLNSNIQNNQTTFAQILINSKADKMTDIIVVSTANTIYSIEDINLDLWTEKNDECAQQMESLQIKMFPNLGQTKQVRSAALVYTQEYNKPLLLVGGDHLTTYDIASNFEVVLQVPLTADPSCHITKLQASHNMSLVYALQENGKMWKVCPFSLIFLSTFELDFNVKDFILMEDLGDITTQVLLLSKPEFGQKSQLRLASYDGLQEVYNFEMNQLTNLVPVSTFTDDVLFMEGQFQDDLLQKIVLRTITKSQPEFRLQRLLRQCKFKEATEFAKHHELDLQLVYMKEARYCVSHMSPWTSEFSGSKTITSNEASQLITILGKISDLEFVVECCLKAIPPNIAQTRELLTYARDLIFSCGQQVQNYVELQTNICHCIQRLDTLEIIAENIGTEQWLHFYEADLLEECVNYLKNHELDCAAIIWVRHEAELLKSLLCEHVVLLLQMVPSSTEQETLLSWLNAFVPSVLTVMPEALPDIIDWLHEKTKLMEWDCREQWPSKALEFCESALQVLQPPATEGVSDWLVQLHQQHSQPYSPLQQLQSTRNALSDLFYLQTNLNISLTMTEYTQPDKQKVAHILLSKADPNQLKVLVNNLLGQIIQENMLDLEDVICSFIEISIGGNNWWFWDHVPWERKILTLISFLQNNERILSCILMVLKAAPVPWNANVLKPVEETKNWNHPLAAEVKHQKELVVSKLILKKYSLCDRTMQINESELDYVVLVRAIFQHGHPEMLEDALQLLHMDKESQDSVHSIYVEHLLETGDCSKALNHIQSLPSKMCAQVAEKILYKIKSMLKQNSEEVENYIEFLEPIRKCIENAWTELHNANKTMIKELMKEVDVLRKNYELEKKFQIQNRNYLSHIEKEEVFLHYVNTKVGEDPAQLLANVMRVSQLLGMTATETSLLLATAACNIQHFSLLTVSLGAFDATQESSSYEVELLSKICKSVLPRFQEVTAADATILTVLQHVLQCTLIDCSFVDEEKVLDLLNNIQHIIELNSQRLAAHSVQDVLIPSTRVKDPYHHWTFMPIYEDVPMNAEASCQALQYLFSVSMMQLRAGPLLTETSINCSSDDTEELLGNNAVEKQESRTVEQLILTVHKLHSENNDLLAFKLVCDIIPRCFLFPKLLDQLNMLLCQYGQILLQRVLSSRKADLPIALSLLQTFPNKDAVQWLEQSLKRVRHECNYLTRMAQLAIDYAQLSGSTDHLPRLQAMLQTGTWGKQLHKLGVSNKVLMRDDGHQNASIVLLTLIHECPDLSLSILRRFCTDFELPFLDAIMYSLEHLILSWQPGEVAFVKRASGLEEIAHMDFEPTMKKAYSLVKAVDVNHKRDLERRLNKIWDKLNSYHYEMYLCLLNLKNALDPTFNMSQSEVLLFLKPYKRQVPPQAHEIEKWLRQHPDDTTIPAIASCRLPYPMFVEETQKMIEIEANLTTYHVWLQAPAVLNCITDQICVAAVKNSISSNICLTNLDEWCIQPRDEKLINDVEECVNCMTDNAVSTALLDYVGKRVPPGLDKLTVVELCLKKLQLWKEESQHEESIDLEKKILKRVQLYTSIHVLHIHGLGRREYIALAENPVALVEALYNDPSILERGRGIAQHYPDIHAAVIALVQLNNLHIERIRTNLLEGWLLSESLNSGALDESFVDSTRVWQQFDEDMNMANLETETDLLKVRYLLQAGDKQDNMDYLVGICFSTSGTCNARVKLRALSCLFWLAPTDQLATHTGRDVKSIKELAKTLFFLSELEHVQVQLMLTVQEFEVRDKSSIVESLWRAHSQNPRAVMLMCRLCTHYNIHNPQVWANLLTQMQHLNMLQELQLILPKLNRVAPTLCTPQYVSAWNKVLLTAFEKADCPMSEGQEKACVDSLTLLKSCPLLKDMKTKQIFRLCINVNRYDFAALILPLTPTVERSQLLEELLQSTSLAEVTKSINKMKRYGSLPISQALQIIEKYNKI